MKLLHWLSTWLFPEKCILCGRILEYEQTDLCKRCRLEAPECAISKNRYPFIDRWTGLWYYENDVRYSLLRYKFHNRRNYAAGYARLLAMKLMKEDRLDFDVLTWIPISQKRLRQRGFDQVQLLAEKLSQELHVQSVCTLSKVRDNPKQSGIVGEAQRRANVLGAYRAVQPELFAGKRVLLLDDIVTTGATASECARVLLTAGASRVDLAVLAVTRQSKKTDR